MQTIKEKRLDASRFLILDIGEIRRIGEAETHPGRAGRWLNPNAVILAVRPADFFSGVKSNEVPTGHIPGFVNQPFSTAW